MPMAQRESQSAMPRTVNEVGRGGMKIGDELEPGTKNFQWGSMGVADIKPTFCMTVKMPRCSLTYVVAYWINL